MTNPGPDGNENQVNIVVDALYGLETDATHGAAARFVQAHATKRPAVTSGQPARWPHFDALRTHVGWAGPNCTLTQINAAITAFRTM
jgi:hypothetical protein